MYLWPSIKHTQMFNLYMHTIADTNSSKLVQRWTSDELSGCVCVWLMANDFFTRR